MNEITKTTQLNEKPSNVTPATKQFDKINKTIELIKIQQAKHMNSLKELRNLLFGGDND